MPDVMNRRDALKAAFGAALPAVLFLGRPQQGPSDSSIVSRLQMPDLGGRRLGPITDYDNDPRIIAIEKKIRCRLQPGRVHLPHDRLQLHHVAQDARRGGGVVQAW